LCGDVFSPGKCELHTGNRNLGNEEIGRGRTILPDDGSLERSHDGVSPASPDDGCEPPSLDEDGRVFSIDGEARQGQASGEKRDRRRRVFEELDPELGAPDDGVFGNVPAIDRTAEGRTFVRWRPPGDLDSARRRDGRLDARLRA
jgi:hypothetical protein